MTDVKLHIGTRTKTKNVSHDKSTSFPTMEDAEREADAIWQKVRKQRRPKIVYATITYKGDDGAKHQKCVFTGL